MILFIEVGKQEVVTGRILEYLSVFSCFHLNMTEVLRCSYFVMVLYALKTVKEKNGTYINKETLYSH